MTKSIATSRKKGIVAYVENPFWDHTSIKVGKKRISVAGGHHVDTDSGEALAHSGIHIVQDVDKDEFVKLYTKNVKAFFDLKPSSMKILMFLVKELQKYKGTDAIYISWQAAEKYFLSEELKVSRTSFQRSIVELIEKKFLAESDEPNKYWFNPHLFFNGDRMTFIREYRVKKKDVGKMLEDRGQQRLNIE